MKELDPSIVSKEFAPYSFWPLRSSIATLGICVIQLFKLYYNFSQIFIASGK